MKNLLVICTLMFSGLAFASDNIDASTWLSSDYLYRGESLSGGEAAAGLDLRVSNIVFDGVFVSAETAVWDLGGTDANRIDAGVGYGSSLFDGRLGYSLSAHRVIGSELESYSELRVGVFTDLNSQFRLFGGIEHLVDGRDSKDTFIEAGLRLTITDFLWSSVSASAVHNDERDNTDFHNASVSVGWQLLPGLSLVGKYSHGGDRLDNEHSVSVRYSF